MGSDKMKIPTHELSLHVQTTDLGEWKRIFGMFSDYARMLGNQGTLRVSVESRDLSLADRSSSDEALTEPFGDEKVFDLFYMHENLPTIGRSEIENFLRTLKEAGVTLGKENR